MLIDRRLIAHFDFGLLGITLALPLLGLVVLYSAGYDPDLQTKLFDLVPLEVNSPDFAKQLVFIGNARQVMQHPAIAKINFGRFD